MRKLFTAIFLLLILCFSCKSPVLKNEVQEISESSRDSLFLDSLNKTIRKNLNNPDLYLQRAEVYQKLKKDKAFLEDIKRVLDLQPDKEKAFELKAEYFKYKKKFDDYRMVIENCLKANETGVYCLLEDAWINIILKNYNKTFLDVNKVLKENPYNAEAYYYKGLAYTEIENKKMAISSLQTSIESDNDYIKSYLLLANIYAQTNDSLALIYYNNALRIDSNNLEARYGKSMYFQNLGQYLKAIEEYKSISKIEEYREPMFNIGYVYYHYLKDYEKSVNFFEKAIALDSSYSEAFYYLGLNYEQLKKFKLAEDNFKKALYLDPTFTQAAESYEKYR